MTKTTKTSPGARCRPKSPICWNPSSRHRRRDPRRDRREVPEYARPLEGSFGRGVRTGVTEALRRFVAELIATRPGARGPGREVYAALGAGELRAGRTLDALQSAYRWARAWPGGGWPRRGRARAWSPRSSACSRSRSSPTSRSCRRSRSRATSEAQSRLGRRARAGAQRAGGAARARPAAAEADLPRQPRRRAGAAADGRGARVRRGATASAHRQTARAIDASPPSWTGWLRGRPGRRTARAGARADRPPRARERPCRARADRSAGALARLLVARPRDSASGRSRRDRAPALVRVEDHLAELLLLEGGPLVERVAVHRLAALDAPHPKGPRAHGRTALAYVQQQGNAAAMARDAGAAPADRSLPLAACGSCSATQLDDPDAPLRDRGGASPPGGLASSGSVKPFAVLLLTSTALIAPATASAAGRCGDHPWCDTALSADARAGLLLEGADARREDLAARAATS